MHNPDLLQHERRHIGDLWRPARCCDRMRVALYRVGRRDAGSNQNSAGSENQRTTGYSTPKAFLPHVSPSVGGLDAEVMRVEATRSRRLNYPHNGESPDRGSVLGNWGASPGPTSCTRVCQVWQDVPN